MTQLCEDAEQRDIRIAAAMLVNLGRAHDPLGVLALVCKCWIERRSRWSPWRKVVR